MWKLSEFLCKAAGIVVAIPVTSVVLLAQASPAAAGTAAGRASFAEHCAGCHGPDAEGSARGPSLANNRHLRSRTPLQISEVIHKGILSAGMPAFNLPGAELNAVALFVRSLNSPAADYPPSGDLAQGRTFFFGAGKCASCHMVEGRGKPVGPDLSNIGHELTIGELRESLRKPSARISTGYQLVDVTLRGGQTLRGFARNRSNFDIELQKLDGELRPVQENEIASIREEKESLMPPLEASGETFTNLLAFLSRLSGVAPDVSISDAEPRANSIRFAEILHPNQGEWLTYDGQLNGNRFSSLDQLNRANVGQMVLKWTAPISQSGLEVTPIVAEGVMYVSGPNQAVALDAATGRQIWKYARPRTSGLVGDASLGTNRGMALLGDKVFMVTDNAHLIALNRTTGRVVWEVVMPKERQHYGSTVAPLVVKDMVVAGVSGGDWGLRGFIAAYKAATGEPAWRFWTVPAKGDPGYETWQGQDPKEGGGSTWLTGSYDSETDTLFWPTATPFPVSDDRLRAGDNLYTDCILALNPDTGKLKWYYQYTPHDTHAWDATEPHVAVDTTWHGEERKLLLHADRNGFYYVFDRTNGKLLHASKFVKVTWADKIGEDGRPVPPSKPSDLLCPVAEATNYNATAFSQVTRLYYVMVLEKCAPTSKPDHWNAKGPEPEPAKKYLRALDLETGRMVWERPQIGTAEIKHWAGVLGTSGGVLFYGDPNGDLVAADERSGATLWHVPTNDVIKASPITYMTGGKQVVALAVGSSIMCFGLP
jgi:PQQ-dependent dehydrogenase (methanol/ethanol family)